MILLKTKSILLLGHTGFVGKELTKKFKKKKIAFDSYSKKQIIYKGRIVKNKKNLLDLMIHKNEIIINCVGENTDKRHMYSRNYNFVKKILELIKKSKKKKYLIHLSSCAVYGSYFHLKNFIISEKTKPDPISKYAKTKLLGELIIRNNNNKNLNYTIIRPSQVVGINMDALGFINLSKFVRRKLFVYVSTIKAVRNYVNCDDLTTLIYRICKTKKIKNNILIISRYSKLQNIIKIIEKNHQINNYFNLIVPKFCLIFFVNLIKFFNKDFPVNKEIIEGLSITAKIKSNIFLDFKNFKLKNINKYLIQISKK